MGKSVKEGVMPKEIIESRYFGQFATDHSQCGHFPDEPKGDCAGRRVPLESSVLKVGWSKETEHVEIAVLRDRNVEIDESALHIQMSRAGLNRAIRALRQARDDAFGRDE